MKQIFHNFLFFLQVQCSIAHVLLTWLDISHFYPLNNTLQWAVTFRSFSHISPLCNKWSRSHSITAWIASEMHSTLTKIRKLEIFSRTWYTMSWTLKWASSGKCVCVPKGCSWSWGGAAWPLVGGFWDKMLHSLMNILDYHCRAFVKGRGGSVVLHCVCGERIGWRRILWHWRIRFSIAYMDSLWSRFWT